MQSYLIKTGRQVHTTAPTVCHEFLHTPVQPLIWLPASVMGLWRWLLIPNLSRIIGIASLYLPRHASRTHVPHGIRIWADSVACSSTLTQSQLRAWERRRRRPRSLSLHGVWLLEILKALMIRANFIMLAETTADKWSQNNAAAGHRSQASSWNFSRAVWHVFPHCFSRKSIFSFTFRHKFFPSSFGPSEIKVLLEHRRRNKLF